MIKPTKTGWKFKGAEPELLTEATTMIRGLYETLQKGGRTEEEAKERIQKVFDLGMKSDEEIMDEAVKKFVDILFGVKNEPEYKVWCETDEIRDKVIVALKNRGVEWANGSEPIYLNPAPMGLIVDNGLWQTKGKEKTRFDDLECEELKAEDLIKEVEGNE